MTHNAWKGLTLVLVLTAGAGAGCRKADDQASQQAAADSAARNLTLLPTTSSPQLSDTAATAAAEPAPARAPERAPAREPRTPAPRKTAPTPRAPAGPSSYTAATGTHVALAVTDAISSRTAQAGQTFNATVSRDVLDGAGHVVIPAGSTVTGTIVEVKSGGTKNAGTLTLAMNSVNVRGTSYPLAATIESAATIQQGRGVGGAEAAKVGGGAAVGAIAGRILGKNTRGTVIGAVVGAAAGAGVAAATRAVDIVLPAGAEIDIALSTPITVATH